MTRDDARLDNTMSAGKRLMPPAVPGIIDGLMTMQLESEGSISFRVIIGVSDRLNDKHDLLELIISPEYIGDLSRALADHGTGIAADSTLMQQFPATSASAAMPYALQREWHWPEPLPRNTRSGNSVRQVQVPRCRS